MAKPILKVLLLISFSLLIFSCAVVVDEEELTKQLEETYNACKNEGIDDLDSLENTLNNGGNNLSRACRVALGNINFSGIASTFDITLNFELPSPLQEINPLLNTSSSWQAISRWSGSDSLQTISTGLDTTQISGITLQGVDSTGSTTNLTNFSIQNMTMDDIAISYTTDYSGSMLRSDIEAVDGYFQDFHTTLPDATLASVAIFSGDVTAKTNGFISNKTTINSAFTYDDNYTRASTALYDAWSDALTKLDATNKKFSLNIITTDGFENSSTIVTSSSAMRQKIVDSNAFNIVIASSWSEPKALESLVSGYGIVLYKYQIDEAQKLIADIKTMLSNIKIISVSDDVSGFNSLNLQYENETKLSVNLL